MVSYGDSEFQQWAEENDFNDNDMVLIKKEVDKRKWIWVLVWLGAIAFTGLGNGGFLPKILEGIALGIGSLCLGALWFGGLSLLAKCVVWSRIVKYGTMNPKQGLLGFLAGLVLVISWISIIPLIFYLIQRKKLWGTGIDKLIKKGLIGNHEEAA